MCSKFVFGPSAWLRGLIKPTEGRALAYVDWSQQEHGIAGGVYTQTTDVEGEVNGLMTYDREVQKLSAEELQEIHQEAKF